MIDILLRVLAGAAVAIIGAIVIDGIITKAKIKAELRKNNISAAMIDAIDDCDNIVTLEDLDGSGEIEVRGEGVAKNIHVGDMIFT